MERSSHRIWFILPQTIFGILCVLILGLWGYIQWANRLPPYRPPVVVMPSPNGYTRAAAIAARLPAAPEAQGKGPRAPWPTLPPDQLRAALPPARVLLDELRGTFALEWRAPPVRSVNATFRDLAACRRAAHYFFAESRLAESEGDEATAIQRNLDSMELGARMARGGVLLHARVSVDVHAVGFYNTERMVPELSAAALPAALTRVRRIRAVAPPFAEIADGERVYSRDALTQIAPEFQNPTPARLFNFVWEHDSFMRAPRSSADRVGGIGLRVALTPKRRALRNIDNYYRRWITESGKPLPQRQVVPIPPDPVSQIMLGSLDAWATSWQATETELALLEAALAIEMHQREHRAYPRRLSEISRRWLPKGPLDPWGQPLAYRLRAGKPLLYSLGPDGKDDGGLPVRPRDLTRSTRGDRVFGALTPRR